MSLARSESSSVAARRMQSAVVLAATAALGVGLGLVSRMVPPLFLLGLTGSLVLVAFGLFNYGWSLRVILAAKSNIDLFYRFQVLSAAPQKLVAVLVPVIGVFHLLKERKNVLLLPAAWPILAFTAMNVLALLVTADTNTALQNFFRVCGAFVIYFAADSAVRNDHDVITFSKLFLLFMLVPQFLAALEISGVLAKPEGAVTYSLVATRISGTFHNPWDLAAFTSFSIPLILFLISETRSAGQKVLLYVYLLSSIVIMYYTSLKFAHFIVVTQVVLWLWLVGRRKSAFLFLSFAGLFAMLNSGFMSMLYADVSVLWTRVAPVDTALSGRVGIWRSYLANFSLMPPLYRIVGTGLDYVRVSRGAKLAADPHNDFLRILVSNGVLGLCIYGWLLASMVRIAQRATRFFSQHDDTMRRFSYAVICMLVVYVASGISARTSEYVSFGWLMWFFLGALVAVQARESAQEERAETAVPERSTRSPKRVARGGAHDLGEVTI